MKRFSILCIEEWNKGCVPFRRPFSFHVRVYNDEDLNFLGKASNGFENNLHEYKEYLPLLWLLGSHQ